ncbi:MAG TPA: FG-GAP-like repeat-containing protein, partial [Chthoniobacteraceae bacterium]|nr:FG-GAP-like repeat-containing protein [Chthoniobacteraceae bacterium]
NTIGGTVSGARNVISGNGGDGILITANLNFVEGNYIGTNSAGTRALGNANNGIEILGGNANIIGAVGGSAPNLISGHEETVGDRGYGIIINNASDNQVLGNFIGTDLSGTAALGNGNDGIAIRGESLNTAIGSESIGDRNIIAFNGGAGVSVDASSRGISIRQNSIHDNAGLGIDLNDDGITPNDPGDGDSGANDLFNHPVITAVIPSAGGGQTISGTINSTPNSPVRIEVFRADPSTFEGQTFVGFTTVTTDASGSASFTVFASGSFAAGTFLTATATDENPGGAGTSEFGTPFQVGGLPPGARLNISDVVITEGQSGATNAIFTVTLSEAATQTVTVDFRTLDLTAHANDNDYLPTSGTLTFAPGQLLATISVPVNGDTLGEARERFLVELSNALNANIEDNQGTGVIRDDDHHLLVTGSSKGSLIRVFDARTGKTTASFDAFEPGYRGGVRVATGDVNGDGINDIIAGGGTASGGRVRVFDGVSFEPLSGVLGDFDAFGRFYRGGVFVAAGDVDGDGRAEVIVSPSAGSSAEVRVFSAVDGSQLSRFTAFGKGSGGVRVAAGDVNGDGRAEVIAGAGLGSTVRIFDALAGLLLDSESGGGSGQNELRTFGRKFRGGVYVAAGDVNGDGLDDVIAGAASDQRTFRVFTSPLDEDVFEVHDAYAGALRGVRVSTVDVNSDGIADIVAGKARGDAKVSIFEGPTLKRLLSLSGYPTRGSGGVFVG